MTTLILVRHGQAAFGSSNYDQLSPLGARQARALGEWWARLKFTADAFYSGSMSRQQDTARHTLDALGAPTTAVQTHAGFNEYGFEGILRAYIPLVAREHPELGIERGGFYKSPKMFQAAFEKAIAFWLQDRSHEHKAFESWREFSGRVTAGLREITPPARERVVAFTSGGVIAVALREALGLTDEMTFRMNWRIYNGSMHSFRVGSRGLSLLGFNNIAHLELSGDDSLITFR
ncbi:MAG: histidine phosphatase family protein [Stenotrophobium sp.]